MSTLSPALDAAFAQDLVTPFFAVEIAVPDAPVRLLDGSGLVSFGGRTFVGQDPTYGVLASGGAISDGVDGEAPSLVLVLMPPTNTAVAALAAPSLQGTAVSVWIGAVSAATGQVIGEPDLRFIGDLDVPTLKFTNGVRTLELLCVSAWERMFADNEGVRLSDAWHQDVWPSETGLIGVTSVPYSLPWGADGAVPAIRSAPSAGTPSTTAGVGGGLIGGGSVLGGSGLGLAG